LPKSPNDNWIKVFGKDYTEYIYRLGNYLLLNKNINKNIENSCFEDKKIGYLSGENIVYSEKEYFKNLQIWTPDELNRRSEKMAKMAKKIWKISEYKS
jgi:hypothetical protein